MQDALSTRYMMHHGRNFKVEIFADEASGPPWKMGDGHGFVSAWTRRCKRAGERVVCEDRGAKRYYNVAETMVIARRDGWGAPEQVVDALTARLGRPLTTGEVAALAVDADFEYLRRWCNDEWCYVGVIVTDQDSGDDDSIWGVESDATDYLTELADEMASGLHPLAEAHEAACLEIASD